jgi:hypothetical protein
MIDKVKDLYKNLKPRERILFYSAIGAFVLMLCDFLVLGPILSHISVLDTEIKSKSQSIQRDMRILSYKDSIYKEYKVYQSYLDTGEKSQEEIIAGLLKKLEALASQDTITITNVMPGELEDKPIYKIYKTTLDFEGALKDVLTFMNQLEESDNLFQIVRYQMEPKSKAGSSMKCNMDITRILITEEDMDQFRPAGEEAEPEAAASAAPAAEGSAPSAAPSAEEGAALEANATASTEPI